ncbi:hypothetical protein BESB_046570 [Besnoitia besnoiti]|uniref:Uncharacterized protein n=1 Tax=Besnoitia besnoiti TaxID=94643 RepID=A0A2A9MEP5_BESBE|nr:hypothetical protein BESB_046570 [Besnoitia besnoiti]PFH36465.1 hypothetical protein BESB_046570 [Besnoitia besnoiti]
MTTGLQSSFNGLALDDEEASSSFFLAEPLITSEPEADTDPRLLGDDVTGQNGADRDTSASNTSGGKRWFRFQSFRRKGPPDGTGGIGRELTKRAHEGDEAATAGMKALNLLEQGEYDDDLLDCVQLSRDLDVAMRLFCHHFPDNDLRRVVCGDKRKHLVRLLNPLRQKFGTAQTFLRRLTIPLSHPVFVNSARSPMSEVDLQPLTIMLANAVKRNPDMTPAYSIFDAESGRSCVATELSHIYREPPRLNPRKLEKSLSKRKEWRLRQVAAAAYPAHADAMEIALVLSALDFSGCRERWIKEPYVTLGNVAAGATVQLSRKLATELLVSFLIAMAYSANDSEAGSCSASGSVSEVRASCRRLKINLQLQAEIQKIYNSVADNNLSTAEERVNKLRNSYKTVTLDEEFVRRGNGFAVLNAFADTYMFLQQVDMTTKGARFLRFLNSMGLKRALQWYLTRVFRKLAAGYRNQGASALLPSSVQAPQPFKNVMAASSGAHTVCGIGSRWLQKFVTGLVEVTLSDSSQAAGTAELDAPGAPADSAVSQRGPEGTASAAGLGSGGITNEGFDSTETPYQEPLQGQASVLSPSAPSASPVVLSFAAGTSGADAVIGFTRRAKSIGRILRTVVAAALAADLAFGLWFPGPVLPLVPRS